MNYDGFDPSRILDRVLRHWRRYLGIGIGAGALMYGLTFLMPTWYRSRAVILPPEETENSMGGAGLSALRMLSKMPTLGGGINTYTSSDIYHAILVSRTVQQAVVERFQLTGVYKVKNVEKALKEFRNHVKVTLASDGTISVDVEDRSRDRAAAMANALIEELDRYNVEKRNSQAKRTRIFMERRVAETDSSSKRAELLLREYQEVHHVIAPIDAEAASVAPLADLMARQVALQVQLSVLRSYLNENNERVVQMRTELEQLNNQIARAPRIESEVGRLVRDVKLYQQTYVLLIGQLEEARLRETMDTPTVSVLDPAIPIERRAKPLRAIWAAAALLLSVVAAIVWDERPVPAVGVALRKPA